jgi:hypothetical protein
MLEPEAIGFMFGNVLRLKGLGEGCALDRRQASAYLGWVGLFSRTPR